MRASEGLSVRSRISRLAVFAALSAVGCAADLWTKDWMFRHLGEPDPLRAAPPNVWWLWEGYVGFETSLNTGGMFGLGQGMVGWLAWISIFAIAAILVWISWHPSAADWFLVTVMGLITGGILGNLYDRLGFANTRVLGVRDWILLRYHDYTWPNFNIADSLLVCGTGLLLWYTWRAPYLLGPANDSPAIEDLSRVPPRS